MPSDSTTQLQLLIDRIARGDQSARRELLERAYDRLRRLAGAILHRQFPALAARHEAESILHDTWLRLLPALDAQPPTVADFFRLAAHKVRQTLLDLVDREKLRQDKEQSPQSGSVGQPADLSHEPGRLADWTEFHGHVAKLPDAQREVFELHYYLDLTQAEISDALKLHPRQVSRLWVAAAEQLAANLPPGG